MIDAKFHCGWCSITWGSSSDAKTEIEAANYIRRARTCRQCKRAAKIEKIEERKIKS